MSRGHRLSRKQRLQNDRRSAKSRTFEGAILGALGGALLLGVGVLRALFAIFRGRTIRWPEVGEGLIFALIYSGAFALAGAAVGALWPMTRSRFGAYSLGYLATAIVVSILVLLAEIDTTSYLSIVTILTAILGTFVGREIDKEAEGKGGN